VPRLDESWLEGLLQEWLPDRPGAISVRGAQQLGVQGLGVQELGAQAGCQGDPPRFPIYSIAKVLIAVLVVQLSDEGGFTLEEPLARWHPDVPGAEECTLRQVLGHRAGLRDYGGLPAYHEALRESPGAAWSRDTYARYTWREGLLFPPGTSFAYSNPGYRLLVELLEAESGRGLAALVRERIVEPLGLRATTVIETPGDLELLERGESTRLSRDGSARDVRRSMDPEWVFHRTLASTADECVTLLDALFEGRLVSRRRVDEMTALQPIGRPAEPWREPSYGLGLMGEPASAYGRLWGHNGGGPGYGASAFHAPDLAGGPLTVCVLAATEEDAYAERMLREVLDQVIRA